MEDELAWVAGYVVRQFIYPKAVTNPTTDRALCGATALIETNALRLLNRHRTDAKEHHTERNNEHYFHEFHIAHCSSFAEPNRAYTIKR